MFTRLRRLSRHTVSTTVIAAVAMGAVGTGVGYTVASHHAAAATTTQPAAPTIPTVAGPSTTPAKAKAKKTDGVSVATLVNLVATATNQPPAQVTALLATGKSLDEIAGAQAQAVRDQAAAAIQKLMSTPGNALPKGAGAHHAPKAGATPPAANSPAATPPA